MLEIKLRTHVGEGFGDPLHRAAAQACITFEPRGKGMRGYDTRDQACGSTAVSAVQTLARRSEPSEANAIDAHVSGHLRNPGAEGTEYSRC